MPDIGGHSISFSFSHITERQTKELIVMLEFEETKLAFAKFMYSYTFDLENYEQMREVFNFENSMDELKAYIKTREEEEEKSENEK